MKTTLIAAVALATLTSATAPAFAGNAGSSLGNCYNHVIEACNKKSSAAAARACAEKAMNACDTLHSGSNNNNQSQVSPAKRLKLRQNVMVQMKRTATR